MDRTRLSVCLGPIDKSISSVLIDYTIFVVLEGGVTSTPHSGSELYSD